MSISRAKRYSKKRRRYNTSGSKFQQGEYKVINESKYVPSFNKMSQGVPIYRSSWEKKFMAYIDMNKDVVKWSSEPLSIKYFSSEDKRVRNYYPDFYVEFKDGRKVLVEIKPAQQEKLIRNQEKWKAAKKFCEDNGMIFVVMGAKELGIK